jgi:hypothetical protein
VHEHRPERVGRRPVGEPAQAELEGGVRFAEAVEVGAVLLDLRAHALHSERWQASGIESVDAGCLLARLSGESWASDRERVVSKDAARDGLAVDALHNEARSEIVTRLEQEPDLGHGDAAGVRYLQQRELDAALGPTRLLARITPQHERVTCAVGLHGVEGPRLPGRAAGQSS